MRKVKSGVREMSRILAHECPDDLYERFDLYEVSGYRMWERPDLFQTFFEWLAESPVGAALTMPGRGVIQDLYCKVHGIKVEGQLDKDLRTEAGGYFRKIAQQA